MFMFVLLLDRVTKSISYTSAHTHQSVSWLTGITYESVVPKVRLQTVVSA